MHKFAYFLFPRFYSCQTKVNPSFFIQFRDDTIQNTFLGYVRFHVKEKVFCPIPHVFHDVFAAPFSQYESVCSQNMPQMVGPFPLRRSFGRSSVDMEDKSNTFFLVSSTWWSPFQLPTFTILKICFDFTLGWL